MGEWCIDVQVRTRARARGSTTWFQEVGNAAADRKKEGKKQRGRSFRASPAWKASAASLIEVEPRDY